MCGVFAYAGGKKVDITPYLAHLKHRGPDHTGTYTSDGVSLGHCRLSIIDVGERSNQPMHSVSGNSVISFNGEIYNYRELKKDLEREGVRFATESDTEVILEGYERYGVDFFNKMRGMWAFVIHDRKTGELISARDAYGVKPLFYCIRGGAVYFASELRTLRSIGLSFEADPDAYRIFYNLGYFIAPQTHYKDVWKLRAGEVMSWSIKKGEVQSLARVSRYAGVAPTVATYEDAVEALDRALTESVAAHYVADVPVSLLLSGGTDSSVIAALSHKLGKRPVAYHIAIPGSEDTRYAMDIARHLGVELAVEALGEKSLLRQYEQIAQIVDEPTGDTSLIPTSLVYELIKGKSKVVLSGEGGDELFGGYGRQQLLFSHARVRRNHPMHAAFNAVMVPRAWALDTWVPLAQRARGVLLAHVVDDLLGAYLKSVRIIDYPIYYATARDALYEAYREGFEPGMRPSLVLDTVAYLANNLLYKTDNASMASSIESRVPFVDRFLATTARSVLDADPRAARGGKHILKDVLKRYITEHLVDRVKKGFTPSLRPIRERVLADFDEAATFHLEHRDSFGVEGALVTLLESEASRAAIARKYPRFAFALITNWKLNA